MPLPIHILLSQLVILLTSLLSPLYISLRSFGILESLVNYWKILSCPTQAVFLSTGCCTSISQRTHQKGFSCSWLAPREARAPETALLIQLARLVFGNNYLSSEFSSDIFHQEFGFAMGTLFAVTVGNALMHFHEIDIVEQYSKFIVLYKRFIDDIFSIRASPGIPTQNFWMLLIKKMVALSLFIVLTTEAFLS